MKIRLLFILLLIAPVLPSLAQPGKYVYNPRSNDDKAKEARNILPNTQKKEIYRIDFLLPLYLEDLPAKQQVLKTIPSQSMAGIHFYEGILLAIDSLERSGKMYYDIFVHDIGSENVEDIISSGKLETTDLVIGAVQAAQIPTVADYAIKNKINFMSVLSPADAGIYNNPYFIITQPTLETHMSNLIQFSEKTKSLMPTVLLYREESGDEIAFTAYKTGIKRRYYEMKVERDKIDMNKLKKVLVKGQKNLIYTTFLSPASANEILTQLNGLGDEYDLEIIGLPSWKGLPALSGMNKHIDVFIPYGFKYDEDVDQRLFLREEYKRFNRGLPSEMVFRGFETMLWSANILLHHGTIFNESLRQQRTFSTGYNIEYKYQRNNPMYYENTHTYIYKYNNGSLNIIEHY